MIEPKRSVVRVKYTCNIKIQHFGLVCLLPSSAMAAGMRMRVCLCVCVEQRVRRTRDTLHIDTGNTPLIAGLDMAADFICRHSAVILVLLLLLYFCNL